MAVNKKGAFFQAPFGVSRLSGPHGFAMQRQSEPGTSSVLGTPLMRGGSYGTDYLAFACATRRMEGAGVWAGASM